MTVKTVKSSGGDYTSLQAALNACPANLVTGGVGNWEIECYKSVTSDLGVSVPNITTDASHYVRIYTPSTERHNGVIGANSGYKLSSGSFADALTNGGALNLIVEGIEFIWGANGNRGLNNTIAGTIGLEVRECIFGAGSQYQQISITGATGGTVKIRNAGFLATGTQFNSAIVTAGGSGYSLYAYNCTAWSNGTGGTFTYQFDNAAGVTCTAKNCIAVPWAGTSVGTFHGTWGGTNNVTTDGLGPSTNLRTATPTFVNAAGGDLHLGTGDAQAKGYGVDLSADANYPFAVDIDGQARSGIAGWDAGYDQVTFPAAAGFFRDVGSTLSGLGSPGKFFQNPLARAALQRWTRKRGSRIFVPLAFNLVR